MHASIALLGQCESAADCSDEGALRQKCHFATRSLIIIRVHEKFFELTKNFSVILERHRRSYETAVSPSFGHFSGHTVIEVPEIHPLPLHRPRGAGGKSKKRGFCFCKGL